MTAFVSMAAALALLTMAATDSLARVIEAPERGAVRAVLIGIDLYRNVPRCTAPSPMPRIFRFRCVRSASRT